MITELDPELATDFRAKIHEYNEFIRLYFVDYKTKDNIEGRDIWSKICSCMDWLEVSVEGIKKPAYSQNMNIASLEFTHFLVTIDMIIESINHLWLAIGQVNKLQQPFIKDSSIFRAKEFGREYTDEKYVKELRSWFGVHAVNGNEIKVEGFNKEVRFFSSWSSTSLIKKDTFYIRLYSNDNKAEEKYGGTKTVNIEDLIEFVAKRYSTLTQLMDEVDALFFYEKRRLQNTPINWNENNSDLEKLKYLYQQAKDRRLTREFYEDAVLDYINFLSADLKEFEQTERELITRYLKELKPIIPTYYKIIQEVDESEYDVFDLLNMRSQVSKDNFYDFSKVLEYAGGGSNSTSGKSSLEKLIKKGILPYYCRMLPRKKLYLLIHAIDHEYNKTTPRKIIKKKNVLTIDITPDLDLTYKQVPYLLNDENSK